LVRDDVAEMSASGDGDAGKRGKEWGGGASSTLIKPKRTSLRGRLDAGRGGKLRGSEGELRSKSEGKKEEKNRTPRWRAYISHSSHPACSVNDGITSKDQTAIVQIGLGKKERGPSTAA